MKLPAWMFKQICNSLHRLKIKNYEEYRRTLHWGIVSHDLRKDHCEDCKITKVCLVVHHLNYSCLGRETRKDVRTLCGVCHIKEHKRLLEESGVAVSLKKNPKPMRGIRSITKTKRYTTADYLPKPKVASPIRCKAVPKPRPSTLESKCNECGCYRKDLTYGICEPCSRWVIPK
jgi:hypothetical protein